METIIEQQRLYHEERERVVEAMVKEFLHKKNTVRNSGSTKSEEESNHFY